MTAKVTVPKACLIALFFHIFISRQGAKNVSDKIRVIQYGLGPIGSAVARHVVERPELQLVGAVDIDPKKAGRDAGEVMGLGRPWAFP